MSSLIFAIEGRPTRQCHSATLVETPSGLIAAWFGGRIEGSPDAGIWISRQTELGWSLPTEIIAGTTFSPSHNPDSGQRKYVVPGPCWNPVLFRLREGVLLLFFKVGRAPRFWEGWLTRSLDGGWTWDEPRPLGRGPLGPLIGPVKNKPIQRSDGVLLCPSSTEGNKWLVHIEASLDLEHWEVFGPIEDSSRLGAIQPTLLFLPDGRLLALCRTRSGFVARSESLDEGQTWSPLAATTLKNPNAGIDAVTLKDGQLLLVYNNSDRSRSPLVAAVSEDGEHWRNQSALEEGTGEYSYPAVIQGADGRVHAVYTWNRQGIGYVRIGV
jgi:predicted neuraminidase